MLKSISCCSAALILALASVSLAVPVESVRPNIILIFVDDMGYGDPGCYGGTLVKTPNIDALADGGIRFTQGYSISPVCGPSRVGLLTGMQPSRIGVYWNPDMGAVRLPQGHALLPEALKAAGYRTGIVGKWNLSNPSWDPMPVLRYFDQAYDTMVWEGDYWPDASGNYHGVEDSKYGSSKTNAIWGPIHDGDEYLTDRLTRHACTFIAQDAEEEPFFLYLAYNAPHSPLQGRADHLPLLSAIESEAQRLYASMVLAVDEGVGQVVRELERQKIMENTLVLFISDNGPAVTSFKGLPEHWPRDEMLGSTGGLNGKKGTYFEGGIRVPFILHWPAQVEDAFVYDSPVTTLDLFPTLCAIAGTKPSAKTRLDGVNLVPFLLPNQSTLPDRTLLWFSGPSGAVRRGDWKLLFDQDSAPQLYNLEQDPKETMDLAEDESVVVKELSAVVREWRQQVPPPVTPRENLKKKASP